MDAAPEKASLASSSAGQGCTPVAQMSNGAKLQHHLGGFQLAFVQNHFKCAHTERCWCHVQQC